MTTNTYFKVAGGPWGKKKKKMLHCNTFAYRLCLANMHKKAIGASNNVGSSAKQILMDPGLCFSANSTLSSPQNPFNTYRNVHLWAAIFGFSYTRCGLSEDFIQRNGWIFNKSLIIPWLVFQLLHV